MEEDNMIVILDNAEGYSQHEIRFVDIGTLPVKPTVELLLRYMNDRLSYQGVSVPFVHAVVESVEWRTPQSLMPVKKIWEDIREHVCEVGRCRDLEILAGATRLPHHEWSEREAEIAKRPWTPEECTCTCVSGELYDWRRREHSPT
jgi:hypothetical protein